MTNSVFKKTIALSLFGHFTFFSIFSFSFGNKLAPLDHSRVYFWGQCLRSYQLSASPAQAAHLSVRQSFFPKAEISSLGKESPIPLPGSYYRKPPFALPINLEKKPFLKIEAGSFRLAQKQGPSLIFHPLLPSWFPLYFKDRQIAHVELMFNISTGARTGEAIEIKRRISSGNIEVDLLAMRYIGHYLFLQQKSFPANKWQEIKIDLSAKK